MWSSQVVMKVKTIPAAKFKAQCLALLDEVQSTRQALVITKRGKPVAQLVPTPSKKKLPFGKLKARIVGDIVNFSEPEWIK